MRTLVKELQVAVAMTAVLIAIVCGAYPVAVFAVAQGVFPGKANGSIVYHNGVVAGSALIGQTFKSPQYLHPRPSAAGNGYDATASSGSNLGPTSKGLVDTIRERMVAYRQENGLSEGTLVPADAVTASGSGLDPDISVENALLQSARVAKARGWDVSEVRDAIEKHINGRTCGVLGERRVNVLLLNLALDQKHPIGR